MSSVDGLDPGSRSNRRRVQRRTACTECRRRKKKCPQGQPCHNCARPFPQLPCHYTDGPIREDRSTPTNSPRNDFDERFKDRTSSLTLPYLQSIDALAIANTNISDPNNGGTPMLSSQISHLRQHMLRLHPVPVTPAATDTGSRQLSWGADTDIESQDAEGRCQLTLLRDLSDWFSKPLGRTTGDDSLVKMRMAQRAMQAQASIPAPVGRPGDLLSTLPMEWNSLNKELLRLHIEVLSRFKVSLDGSADPKNYFMEHWSPFCLQDPFLLQIILYTASCFAHETGRVHKHYVLQYKSAVYMVLRKRMQSADLRVAGDSTILGVTQLIVDSWYWGGTDELHTHMSGLKKLIRLSGGLQQLGLQGFLSKIVLVHDVAIAIAHETDPTIYGKDGFQFVDPQHTPLEVMFNCPLMVEWPPFKDTAGSLKLHPATAQLLDATRLLLAPVSGNMDIMTEENARCMKTVASAILERLGSAPEAVPGDIKQEGAQVAPEKVPVFARNDFDLQRVKLEATPEPHATVDGSKAAQNAEWHRYVREMHPLDADAPPQDTPQGQMYRCVRSVTLLYCQAISERTSTSVICTEEEFGRIWGEAWKVSLTTWNETVGVYLWVLAAIVPSCHTSPQARFVRTMFVMALMKMAVNNWHIALDAVNTVTRLQKWLRGDLSEDVRQAGQGRASGGEGNLKKHAAFIEELMVEAETGGIIQ